MGIGSCGLCLVFVLRGFVGGLMNDWVGVLVLVCGLCLGLDFVLISQNECVVGLVAQRLNYNIMGRYHEGSGGLY
ncbi:hypothetical protein FPQ18DRAFT_342163 [Pyronema domesticum]|nr:hypothetical protein FPQ18DRAFT_342163 [Pyronema domesticum]